MLVERPSTSPPGRPTPPGAWHPLETISERIADVFVAMG
jgi:hypothetical protein